MLISDYTLDKTNMTEQNPEQPVPNEATVEAAHFTAWQQELGFTAEGIVAETEARKTEVPLGSKEVEELREVVITYVDKVQGLERTEEHYAFKSFSESIGMVDATNPTTTETFEVYEIFTNRADGAPILVMGRAEPGSKALFEVQYVILGETIDVTTHYSYLEGENEKLVRKQIDLDEDTAIGRAGANSLLRNFLKKATSLQAQ